MDEDERVDESLADRLRETTETLWIRGQNSRELTDQPGGIGLDVTSISDEAIAEEASTSLPVVRAWLDSENSVTLALTRDGDTRRIKALLGDD